MLNSGTFAYEREQLAISRRPTIVRVHRLLVPEEAGLPADGSDLLYPSSHRSLPAVLVEQRVVIDVRVHQYERENLEPKRGATREAPGPEAERRAVTEARPVVEAER